jgi:hypothetical protein
VYYGCSGLPYGKEDQTLMIDDEPNKTLWNSKWSGLFLESFKGELLLRNKVQLLDLAFRLWPTLIKLPSTNTIWNHYDVLVKYLKPHLSSYSWNYSWFVQYMNCDNGDFVTAQPSLGMHFESFHQFSFLIFQVIFYFICFLLLALSFVCSWFCLLFIDCTMAFVVLKGKKWCLPLRFLFRDNMDIIAYLTITKVLKRRRIDFTLKICIVWELFKVVFHLW